MRDLPATSVQSEDWLCYRGPEMELLPTREVLENRFVPFGPFGAGFLTGKIDENIQFDPTGFRNLAPRFTPESGKAIMALVDLIIDWKTRLYAGPAAPFAPLDTTCGACIQEAT